MPRQIKPLLLTPDHLDQVFLLLLPNVMEHRSLLVVYVFNFYQTLRVVPHGTKGTGPKFVTRPVYLRSQLRNNTNTVSTLVLLIHLLNVLCTRYAGIAHCSRPPGEVGLTPRQYAEWNVAGRTRSSGDSSQ